LHAASDGNAYHDAKRHARGKYDTFAFGNADGDHGSH
jgi:hypothetical protein